MKVDAKKALNIDEKIRDIEKRMKCLNKELDYIKQSNEILILQIQEILTHQI